jgi:hypothetical protein
MVGNAAQAPAHLFSKGIFEYLLLVVVFYSPLPVEIYQFVATTLTDDHLRLIGSVLCNALELAVVREVS